MTAGFLASTAKSMHGTLSVNGLYSWNEYFKD